MANLLLVIAFPDDEPYLDDQMDNDPELVDMVADGLLSVLNEERRRNCDDAGRSDYYSPLVLNAIPGPQWVDGHGLALLVRAIRLVQEIEEPFVAAREEVDRCVDTAPTEDARTAYEWIATFMSRPLADVQGEETE